MTSDSSDIGKVTITEFEKIPPKEDADAFKRLLEGTYGRQDLQDLSEGRKINPGHYDHNGRYVGPSKQSEIIRRDEIPF